MAGYKYFTVLTDVGKQKLVEAIANETVLDFTEMAVGDSNGTSYDPTPDMTALKHETYRATISSISIDEVDRNIMIFQLVVPSSSGGYYIREAGLFSSDGSLIAIARTAEQYKPQLSEGAGASIDINMRIAISSEAQIYINVPESDSYATQNYVKEEFKKHTQKEDPHQQYMLETYANEIFATKADKTHSHELSSLNGVLPVNKGGTGTNDAFNFVNFIYFSSIAAKIGFEIGGTIIDFCLKLPNNCAFVTLIQGSYFSDNNTFGGILRISKYDNNSTWLYLDRFSKRGNEWRQAIGTIQNNVFSGWKNIRNEDGSIPADLINLPVGFSYIQAKGTGTPDTVFGTAGKWQEITSIATGFPAGTRIWKKIS